MEQELRKLILQKDQMEKELATLSSQIAVIDQTKSFHKGLVDSEGFPRSDIDFGQLSNYRNLKRRKAELNNDHQALMKLIQQGLFALHSTYPSVQAQNQQTNQKKQTPSMLKQPEKIYINEEKQKSKIDYLTPFAKITSVQESSPASKGGLEADDLLSQFVDVNIYSLDWKKQLPTKVKEGQQIKVVVLRKIDEQNAMKGKGPFFELKDHNKYEKLELIVVPNRWQGRGLLGCKIDPI